MQGNPNTAAQSTHVLNVTGHFLLREHSMLNSFPMLHASGVRTVKLSETPVCFQFLDRTHTRTKRFLAVYMSVRSLFMQYTS